MIVRIGSDTSVRLCYVDRRNGRERSLNRRGVKAESVAEWMVFFVEGIFCHEKRFMVDRVCNSDMFKIIF
jgi:hypothetical protein